MTGLLGSFCIFCGCCLGLGLQMRERRSRRNTLEQLERALWHMAQEIRMTRTPMPPLLKQLGENCRGEAGRFFERVSAAVASGGTLSAAWRREAELLPLSPAEKSVVQELDLQGDEEHICHAILLVRDRVTGMIQEHNRKAPEEMKRTAALWVSGAALLVILLI